MPFYSKEPVVVQGLGGGSGGADGKSAYDLAVENGFSGTLEEWLASLKGEQGERGLQGAQGPQGPAGKDGFASEEEWNALVARVAALEGTE